MRSAPTGTLERYAEHQALISNAANVVAQDVAWKDQDESRRQTMTPLNVNAKAVFRIRPGTLRSFAVRIPTLPDDYSSDQERERRERDFKRRRLALDGENPPFDLNSVREKIGSDMITFKNLPGSATRQKSAYYDTSDDEVIAFLLHCKNIDKSGLWQNIVVEYPQRTLTINGQDFPDTDAGWEAAKLSAINTGGGSTSADPKE